MLDKNIKDIDASVELLNDRKKQSLYWLLFLYAAGSVSLLVAAVMPPFGFFLSFGALSVGVFCMFVASWFLFIYLHYANYLFMIHKGLVKAIQERK